MAYNGSTAHVALHQESPALFCDRRLHTLALYGGPQPWSNAPVTRCGGIDVQLVDGLCALLLLLACRLLLQSCYASPWCGQQHACQTQEHPSGAAHTAQQQSAH